MSQCLLFLLLHFQIIVVFPNILTCAEQSKEASFVFSWVRRISRYYLPSKSIECHSKVESTLSAFCITIPSTYKHIIAEIMSLLMPSTFASSSRCTLRSIARPALARTTIIRSQLRNASSQNRSTSPTKPSLNVASASGGPQDPLAYCSSLVQRLDPEAWLTSYFWKGRERSWFLAWRAFNVCLVSS
jgi:hypothetical protein